MDAHDRRRLVTGIGGLRRSWKLLAGVALVAIGLALASAGTATAGPDRVVGEQIFSVQIKKLSKSADRIDLAFGAPDTAPKLAQLLLFPAGPHPLCLSTGVKRNNLPDVNPDPALPNHEVITVFLGSQCLRTGDELIVFAFPVDPSNHLVLKEVKLYTTNGTPDVADDRLVGTGNAKKADWSKFPRFSNLWLCSEPSQGPCNGTSIFQVIGQPITSPDPKCAGFPNFQDPATCPRQELGAYEFEVRFDAKFVDVELIGVYGPSDPRGSCLTNKGEGFAQLACVTKGKESPITLPNLLSLVVVTPKPDSFSILRANQENGIVVQLINQECNLADLQGHPIPVEGLDVCQDGAVTLRFLEGDVHADCVVDVHDQQQIAFRWGSRLGQLLYNDRFDLEPSAPKKGDDDIDAKDLQLVYGRHGSTCVDPHPAQPPVDPKAKVEPPLAG